MSPIEFGAGATEYVATSEAVRTAPGVHARKAESRGDQQNCACSVLERPSKTCPQARNRSPSLSAIVATCGQLWPMLPSGLTPWCQLKIRSRESGVGVRPPLRHHLRPHLGEDRRATRRCAAASAAHAAAVARDTTSPRRVNARPRRPSPPRAPKPPPPPTAPTRPGPRP